MIGQMSASKRICILCGVRTGVYQGSVKIRERYAVCENYSANLLPCNGMRYDPDMLEKLPESMLR